MTRTARRRRSLSQNRDDLRMNIKSLLVETLMLRREPDSIGDDTPLFGPEGLGLDSIDTVTLLAELEKRFGISVRDPARAMGVLKNVDTIVDTILAAPQPAEP